MFGLDVHNWVFIVCLFVIKSLKCFAQHNFSVCVGVFPLVLWKMSCTYRDIADVLYQSTSAAN